MSNRFNRNVPKFKIPLWFYPKNSRAALQTISQQIYRLKSGRYIIISEKQKTGEFSVCHKSLIFFFFFGGEVGTIQKAAFPLRKKPLLRSKTLQSYLKTESKFCPDGVKSIERVNCRASTAPKSRFMPQSSHSTERGPS